MTIDQVRALAPGDSVYWNDPDRGLCSRAFRIQRITVHHSDDFGDTAVTIEEPEGGVLEAFARELS